MQQSKMAQLGVVLFFVGVGSTFVWWYSIGYLFLGWYWAYQISALTFAALMVSPSVVLTIAGLVLYITGRKTFWKSERPKGLLAFLGLVLMVIGGFFGAWYWAFADYAARKLLPPYNEPLVYYLGTNSPYFVLFALWIFSGLLIFADSIEAMLAKRKN
ncbi:MAG TPA: hypothetical protein VJ249_07220 [Candidatus Bathyarchaeia archaeon]|nr:hypothetical protein [Candidatus Bathyarchaeia archaeon]